MGPVFEEVGGSEVDGELFGGEDEVGVRDGGADTLSGFGDGFISHADDIEGWQPVINTAFDFDDFALVAIGDGGIYFRDHVLSVSGIFRN